MPEESQAIECSVEMIPIYVLRMTRLQACQMLVDPKDAQIAVRGMVRPDIAAESLGQLSGSGPKALPAGRLVRKRHRRPNSHHYVALHRKKGGPTPGQKEQCKYCDRKIAPWRMSTHVAANHAEAPDSEKPPKRDEIGDSIEG